MITAIFIDDELMIRKQIESIFLWLDKEIELIGNFANISDAKSFLQNHSVDIIITDICLGNESGMDIAKYIYENNFQTQVIVLSAYKKFEYAVEGYRYGVSSYITKPIDIEELKEVLQRIKKQVYSDQNMSEAKLNSAQYILNFLSDSVPCFENNNLLTRDSLFFCRLNIYIENQHDYDNNFLYQYISNVLQMRDSSLGYVFTKLDTRKAIVLIFPSNTITEKDFRTIVAQDCITLDKIFSETANLRTRLHTSFLNISEKFIFSYDQTEENNPIVDYNDFIFNSIVEKLMTNETEQVLSTLYSLIDSIETPQERILFVNNLLKKLKITIAIQESPENQDFVTYVINIIKSKIGSKQLSAHDRMAAAISLYIEQNFYQDISLYNIAEHMGMNPSYFSRCFKDVMGVNFGEYLVNFRINKAKVFLKEKNISIDVIANAVGYNHTQAFYKNFKRITGMTPNEYRYSLKDKE